MITLQLWPKIAKFVQTRSIFTRLREKKNFLKKNFFRKKKWKKNFFDKNFQKNFFPQNVEKSGLKRFYQKFGDIFFFLSKIFFLRFFFFFFSFFWFFRKIRVEEELIAKTKFKNSKNTQKHMKTRKWACSCISVKVSCKNIQNQKS